MTLPRRLRTIGRSVSRETVAAWLGALASLGVAVLVYTRFSIDMLLNRDEGIYAYGGQQLTHGVAPYASIFDPKTPLATMLSGLGAGIAHLVGGNDLYGIRMVFFACACLSAVAIYLLAARIWHSVLAGVVSAVAFASFQGFARDAISGPDAKTPGVLVTILCMWLLYRRQWFWAGIAASLAFLDWQPFVFFAVAALLAPVLNSDAGRRLRSVAFAIGGLVLPLVLTVGYFVIAGAFGKFFESTFDYPATGVARGPSMTLWARIRHISSVVYEYYDHAVVFATGLAALVVLAAVHLLHGRRDWRAAVRDPFICVVVLTAAAEFGYACYDFQSYPDVYPLIAYPALGLGGVAAALLTAFGSVRLRRLAIAAVLAATAAATTVTAVSYTRTRANNHAYLAQRAQACAIDRILVPGTPLYAVGDPTPLVLTHRRNPDRFIYLDAGVAQWKLDHSSRGFADWITQIRNSRTSVIVMMGWGPNPLRYQLAAILRALGYRSGWLGFWYVFLDPGAWARAESQGVDVSPSRSDVLLSTDGEPLSC